METAITANQVKSADGAKEVQTKPAWRASVPGPPKFNSVQSLWHIPEKGNTELHGYVARMF